jgi:5-methylcytosine-specific restriction endonuclease McrA
VTPRSAGKKGGAGFVWVVAAVAAYYIVAGTARAVRYVAEAGCQPDRCKLLHSGGWDGVAFGWLGVLVLLVVAVLALIARAVVLDALSDAWRRSWPEDSLPGRLIAVRARVLVFASVLCAAAIAAALVASGATAASFSRSRGVASRAAVVVLVLAPTFVTIGVLLARRLLGTLELAVERHDARRTASAAARQARETARQAAAAAQQAKIEAEQREAAERARAANALRQHRELERRRQEQERKRTVTYIRAELKNDGQLRWRVLARDNYTCQICGATGATAELTIDHVTPVSLGGSNAESNLQTLCRSCNSRKGARVG